MLMSSFLTFPSRGSAYGIRIEITVEHLNIKINNCCMSAPLYPINVSSFV